MLKYRIFFSTLENLAKKLHELPAGEQDTIKELIKAVYKTEVPFIYIAPASPPQSSPAEKNEETKVNSFAVDTKSKSTQPMIENDPVQTTSNTGKTKSTQQSMKNKDAADRVWKYLHHGYRHKMKGRRAKDENSKSVKLRRMAGHEKHHAMHTTCFP